MEKGWEHKVGEVHIPELLDYKNAVKSYRWFPGCRDVSLISKFNLAPVFHSKILRSILHTCPELNIVFSKLGLK